MKKNVYELTLRRLSMLFDEFDNIYVSFSGGKDSGVLLNLCIQYIRENNLRRKIGVFHMDYEVQYNDTIRYIDRALRANPDVLEVYRVCVPFKVSTCTSMHQSFWRPWDDDCRDLWVREMPEGSYTKADFPFYSRYMWDSEFYILFSQWYHRLKKAKKTCCLVGIRTQESHHRWRTIYGNKRYYMYHNLKWTKQLFDNIYNAYVIHDWLTTDIWTANGRFDWDYNRLYDLYYQAGVPLDKQRVASPFIMTAQESLHLYRAIDPDTWGKMLCRVNGVNFTALYSRTGLVAQKKVGLPPGHTWESYMYFLLSTLPEKIRLNYMQRLSVSINFWRKKGGCLSEKTIERLKACGIEIEIMDYPGHGNSRRPVRMEYIDDIEAPEFKLLPTFKRMCICILRNDHLCKYMGFAMTKKEIENRKLIMEFYQNIKS